MDEPLRMRARLLLMTEMARPKRCSEVPKCEVCGREFGAETALAQHMRDKHHDQREEVSAPARPERPSQESKKKRGSLRRRNSHRTALSIVAVGVVAALGIYYVAGPFLTSNYPFTCGDTGNFIHVHPYLRIVINGQNVTIPADIGFTDCAQPVHTHDTSGILHVESQGMANYTLGEFFAIWKATYGHATVGGVQMPVVFNSTDILGFKANATRQVVLLVDGKPSTAYGSLVLNTLDYCSALTTGPPCSPSAVGEPLWNNGASSYPYGTLHTIVVEYTAKSS